MRDLIISMPNANLMRLVEPGSIVVQLSFAVSPDQRRAINAALGLKGIAGDDELAEWARQMVAAELTRLDQPQTGSPPHEEETRSSS